MRFLLALALLWAALTPTAADDQAAFDAAWDRIAATVRPADPPMPPVPEEVTPVPVMRPAPLASIFARYERSLLRPVGNCREWDTVDARVRRVVSDAAAFFGGEARLTSCYRSSAHNRRVRGARNSQHIRRKALDFVVARDVGLVDKDALANWVRRHPIMRTRGGVGRYRMAAIHVDVGPKRNWDWRRAGKRRAGRTRYAGLRR
jgi:hypothetical protein